MLVSDEPVQDRSVLFKAFLQTEEEWLINSLQNTCWAFGTACPLSLSPLSHRLALTFQKDKAMWLFLFYFSVPFVFMNARQRLVKGWMGNQISGNWASWHRFGYPKFLRLGEETWWLLLVKWVIWEFVYWRCWTFWWKLRINICHSAYFSSSGAQSTPASYSTKICSLLHSVTSEFLNINPCAC